MSPCRRLRSNTIRSHRLEDRFPLTCPRLDNRIGVVRLARRGDALVQQTADLERDVVVIERAAGKGEYLSGEQFVLLFLALFPAKKSTSEMRSSSGWITIGPAELQMCCLR